MRIWTCLILWAALALISCATIQQGKSGAHEVYQSRDFIVSRLDGAETAASLAQRLLGDANKSWMIEDNNPAGPYKKGQAVIIPLKDENIGGIYDDGYQLVPILCYHRFAETCKSNLCVSKSAFAAQVAYLKNNGYHSITLSELMGFLNYDAAIPAKAVVITMDDGYQSIYEFAYPLLKQYGFTATLFIYTDFVGASKNALTWDHIREMKAGGFEIGSHSITHADLTKKFPGEDDSAYLARITRELFQSKKIIDQELEQDTPFFAYPYGTYNQQILDLSKQAGYKLGLTIRMGGNSFFADPLTLKRSQVLNEDMDYFIDRIQTIQPISLR